MKLTESHFVAPFVVDALFGVAPAGDRRSDSVSVVIKRKLRSNTGITKTIFLKLKKGGQNPKLQSKLQGLNTNWYTKSANKNLWSIIIFILQSWRSLMHSWRYISDSVLFWNWAILTSASGCCLLCCLSLLALSKKKMNKRWGKEVKSSLDAKLCQVLFLLPTAFEKSIVFLFSNFFLSRFKKYSKIRFFHVHRNRVLRSADNDAPVSRVL